MKSSITKTFAPGLALLLFLLAESTFLLGDLLAESGIRSLAMVATAGLLLVAAGWGSRLHPYVAPVLGSLVWQGWRLFVLPLSRHLWLVDDQVTWITAGALTVCAGVVSVLAIMADQADSGSRRAAWLPIATLIGASVGGITVGLAAVSGRIADGWVALIGLGMLASLSPILAGYLAWLSARKHGLPGGLFAFCGFSGALAFFRGPGAADAAVYAGACALLVLGAVPAVLLLTDRNWIALALIFGMALLLVASIGVTPIAVGIVVVVSGIALALSFGLATLALRTTPERGSADTHRAG